MIYHIFHLQPLNFETLMSIRAGGTKLNLYGKSLLNDFVSLSLLESNLLGVSSFYFN